MTNCRKRIKLISLLLTISVCTIGCNNKKNDFSNVYTTDAIETTDFIVEESAGKAEIAKEEEHFYRKLVNGDDVNLLIVGDSIGLGSGASESEYKWAERLCKYLKEHYGVNTTLTNVSLGGNSSYAGYVRTMALDDHIDYDAAIICYGQNDSEKNFGLFYESIILALKNKYPDASIISILESSQKEYTVKMEQINEISGHYDIPVADTIEPFRKEYDSLTVDGRHPNDDGYKIYAETVTGVIDEKAANLPIYHRTDVEPVNKETDIFENFEWHGAEEFTRFDNTYTLEAKINSRLLGIDFTLVSGDNCCRILVDGEEYAVLEDEFNYDFDQRFIKVVNENWDENPITVNHKLEIIFDDNKAADGFVGIAFSGKE